MKAHWIVIATVAAVPACKKSADKASPAPASAPGSAAPTAAPAPAAGNDPACLAGAWTSTVGDKNVYTFKADKTGERVHETDPPAAFTWSMKDPKTAVVVFPEHGDTKRAEFEFTVDCAASLIKFQDSIPFAKS